MCVIFFYDDKAMGAHISLSQLDASESSYPLGHNRVSQPALSQTVVGHSVIVVRRVCSLVSNFKSRHLCGTFTPALPLIADLHNLRNQRPFIVPLRPGDLPCLAPNTVVRLHPLTALVRLHPNYSFADPRGMIG